MCAAAEAECFRLRRPADGRVALTAAALPGMPPAGWGRIVNISRAIVARPDGMVRGNANATTKAALKAHTINLAAELRGSGVTVSGYRPGGVDTCHASTRRRIRTSRLGPQGSS
jgi:NAD(P)-dependent dehydrogenase (short-subunit alcohol dehydrogenase family)